MSATPSRRLVSIGAVHADTIAHAVEPVRRETSTPARFSTGPGGVATNIARAVSRLGVRTTLMGAVGDDGAARGLREQLAREGVALSLAERPGFVTGQYLAFHDPDGGLAAACVDDSVLAKAPADLFDDLVEQVQRDLTPQPLWFLDANLPQEMLVRVVGLIGGGFVIANAVSDAKAPRLRNVLKDIDCLSLNTGEAAALLEMPGRPDKERLARALIDTGLKSFVLTDRDSDLLVYSESGLERLSPPRIDIVDVTGAGDALTAGTISALARNHELPGAVRFGLGAAALTLQSTGAVSGRLSWERLADFDKNFD